MKKTLLLCVMLVLLLPLAGCEILLYILFSGEDSGAVITVTNRGYQNIYEVFVSESSSSEWGADLTGDGVLTHGQALSLSVDVGMYDISVVGAAQMVITSVDRLSLGDGEEYTVYVD